MIGFGSNNEEESPNRSKPFKWLRRFFRRLKYRHCKFKDGKYMKGRKDVELWKEGQPITRVDYPDFRWQALTSGGRRQRLPAKIQTPNNFNLNVLQEKSNKRPSAETRPSGIKTSTPKKRNAKNLTNSEGDVFDEKVQDIRRKRPVPKKRDTLLKLCYISDEIPTESDIYEDKKKPDAIDGNDSGIHLELRPVYDLHTSSDASIRSAISPDTSIGPSLLENNDSVLQIRSTLPPSVRYINNDHDIIEVVSPIETAPKPRSIACHDTPGKKSVSFEPSSNDDIAGYETDWQNVRNQLQCEDLFKGRRRQGRRGRRKKRKIKNKIIQTFLRPKGYKPLKEDKDSEEVININWELELKSREARIRQGTGGQLGHFTNKKGRSPIRRAAHASLKQVMNTLSNMSLESPAVSQRPLSAAEHRMMVRNASKPTRIRVPRR